MKIVSFSHKVISLKCNSLFYTLLTATQYSYWRWLSQFCSISPINLGIFWMDISWSYLSLYRHMHGDLDRWQMQRGGPKIGLGQTITHGMVLRVQLLFFISLLWRFWTLVWWQAALVTYSYGFHYVSGVSFAVLCCCVCPCHLTSWKEAVLFWIPVERETWEEKLFRLNMYRVGSN